LRRSWPWRQPSMCASASCPIFRIPCESGRFEGRIRRASSGLEEGSMRYPTTHTCRKRKDGGAASSASPGISSPAPRQPDLAQNASHSDNFLVTERRTTAHWICLSFPSCAKSCQVSCKAKFRQPMISWQNPQDISQSNLVPVPPCFYT
jgi:hypothetical protein